MRELSTGWKIFFVIFAFVMVGLLIFVNCTYSGRALYNTYEYNLQKVDDATLYKTKKTVEDTCRSMIASYNSDKLTFEQYKDSDDKEKQSWAEQARMRANKTASIYNEYILKNEYIWSGNVPYDINMQLQLIK